MWSPDHRAALGRLVRSALAIGSAGLLAALSTGASLTFVTVMLVSFIYIRFVGGNIRALAEN